MRGGWKLHKQKFESLVADIGVAVEVRQPAAKTTATTTADKVLGKKSVETAVGRIDRIDGIWSTDYLRPDSVIPGDVSESIAALGKPDKVDAMFRTPLANSLLDPEVKNARTLFDTCKDVVYDGMRWEVVGTKRTGLPGGGPYILWVALRKLGE